ncbi:MAG: 1-acyl-sn-glycerol-3-phosphate acyltransferase [Myxococcales bacterium]|nr:1-acyl-sn-glycerol-3-phosphate acyltransferase [Myxococcales bacterium]
MHPSHTSPSAQTGPDDTAQHTEEQGARRRETPDQEDQSQRIQRSERRPIARPDLVELGRRRLSLIERLQLRWIRRSFEPGWLDRLLRFGQRTVGQAWIHHCTKHLRHVHGLEHLPPLDGPESILVVANHRSFFDLYVVTATLVRGGLRKRIVFPVRSNFFYDSITGWFVNGIMSFFAMYPPIFRERRKAMLNPAALSELGWLLRRGGVFAGLHPEGTRKRDDDPYTFLPAQPGVGKVIHESRVTVVPVFVNGLLNDLPRQVRGNFNRKGPPIHVVFGPPIDFGDLLEERGSPRVYRAIAERCLEAIGELGQREKQIRGNAPR